MKLSAIVAAAAVLAAGSLPARAAEISIYGSTTVANNLLLPGKAQIEAVAKHEMKIFPIGSGNGLVALAAGKANMAMVSSPLAEVAAKLNAKTPGSIDVSQYKAFQVGEVAVAFIRHSSNPVAELKLDQVAAIMKGTIKNWKEVGGPDLAIIIAAEPSGGGVRTMVEDELLAKATIAGELREARNADVVSAMVEKLEGAIGVTSPASTKGNVLKINTDKSLAQPLILVTKGEPTPEMTAIIEAA